MEGCSVCKCDANEIPKGWVGEINAYSSEEDKIGAFSHLNVASNNEKNSIITGNNNEYSENINNKNKNYIKFLRETEDDESIAPCNDNTNHYLINVDNGCDWTDMSEDNVDIDIDKLNTEKGEYVNLLQNPESFTGYSGPSAIRVWQAIQQENCFGGLDDICVEKRVFYRLMSGMQASISTHIARQYFYPDEEKWGYNFPLFYRAVGDHPDRINNMYFTFLFLLRAVVKVGDSLSEYPFYTGNLSDDLAVKESIKTLVAAKLHDTDHTKGEIIDGYREAFSGLHTNNDDVTNVEECRNGFDESVLFQVPSHLSGIQYWKGLEEKQILREEFRNRFRNITRIMDCVSCEKCRVWGKLQILGIGTAIKILLTPEGELAQNILNRQEIIALINSLHQFSTSIEFASQAERKSGIDQLNYLGSSAFNGVVIIIISFLLYKLKQILFP